MSDFEHDLLDALEQDTKFDPARAEVLRLQVGKEFKNKKKRMLIWTWVFHAVYIAFFIPGVILAFGLNDLRTTIQGVGLMLIGAAGLIIIKLWYWIVHGRLEVLREIKRLELRWTLAQSKE